MKKSDHACLNSHKLMAMTGTPHPGYAGGGLVRGPAVGAAPVTPPTMRVGKPMPALEKTRRNNGVRGMKTGGKVGGCKPGSK